ncbi:hypothetical protein PTKIN_Ptkin14bG0138800 [Pterospermum kingtungense]
MEQAILRFRSEKFELSIYHNQVCPLFSKCCKEEVQIPFLWYLAPRSVLSSLTKLNQRDCNLSEGAISDCKRLRSLPDYSQWMGVAFYCIFVSAFTDVYTGGEDEINGTVFQFGRKYKRPRVMKNHLWLHCSSCDEFYPSSSEEKCGATENLLSTNLEDQECDDILKSSIHCDESYKVKCGVHMVYEQDLEENKSAM